MKKHGVANLATMAIMLIFFMDLSQAADGSGGIAPASALVIELLILAPLAAAALYLKKRRSKLTLALAPATTLVATCPQVIGDDAKAQILTLGAIRFLVIHGKNGASHAVQITERNHELPAELSVSDTRLNTKD
jgi:hypothetical protein